MPDFGFFYKVSQGNVYFVHSESKPIMYARHTVEPESAVSVWLNRHCYILSTNFFFACKYVKCVCDDICILYVIYEVQQWPEQSSTL